MRSVRDARSVPGRALHAAGSLSGSDFDAGGGTTGGTTDAGGGAGGLGASGDFDLSRMRTTATPTAAKTAPTAPTSAQFVFFPAASTRRGCRAAAGARLSVRRGGTDGGAGIGGGTTARGVGA